MTNFPSAISMAMKMEGSYVASVVLTGLAVVFLALLLLILVFKIFGVIFSGKQKNKAKPKVKAAAKNDAAKSDKIPSAPAKTADNNSVAKATGPAAPIIEDGIDLEVIAVISAAIAAMSSSSGRKMRLVSVKTSGANRRAWAQAGLNDNTRPF